MAPLESAVPDTEREYLAKLPVMTELLGGDQLALRTAKALWRGQVRTPQEFLSAPIGDISDLRDVGLAALDRVRKIKGSLIDFDVSRLTAVQSLDFDKVAAFCMKAAEQMVKSAALPDGERQYVARLLKAMGERHTISVHDKEKG